MRIRGFENSARETVILKEIQLIFLLTLPGTLTIPILRSAGTKDPDTFPDRTLKIFPGRAFEMKINEKRTLADWGP